MTIKDWIQYGSALAMIVSGIILAILSFLHSGDIAEGVLWYVAQALTYAGGIFGVSIYFKTKLGDFESKAAKKIEEAAEEVERKRTRREYDNDNPEPINIHDM